VTFLSKFFIKNKLSKILVLENFKPEIKLGLVVFILKYPLGWQFSLQWLTFHMLLAYLSSCRF